MEKLVVATNNLGKLKEIKEILGDKYLVLSQSEAGLDLEVEENGYTFYDNAFEKALEAYYRLKCNVLADDSGLEVESLNGEPGVYSARYAEGGIENCKKKLLKELAGKENRNAKFTCQLVFIRESGEVLSAVGETYGSILYGEKGENGFGYDSLFYSFDLQKSFGEATDEEKNGCSHRYYALKNLREELK